MAVIQKITYTGTTSSSSLWTWKIEVIEETGDVTNYTSPVTIKLYLGRTVSGGRSYFAGSCKLNYKIGNLSFSENWSKSSYTYINGGDYYLMGSHTFNVPNLGGPNTYTAQGYMRNASFNPSTADASGNITLSVLHIPPQILGSAITFTERNSSISSLNIGSKIVNILSQKRFSLANAITYSDSATLRTINIYYKNTLIGTSSTTTVDTNFSLVDITELSDVPIIFEVIDSLNGTGRITLTYDVIKYFLPQVNDSTSSIIRKTTNNTTLTDNRCNLTINGLYYGESSDAVGTNNSISHIYYRIWKVGTTEPSTWTDIINDVTAPSGGNINISDFTISDSIDYKYPWEYKMYVTDIYGKSSNIKSGKVPTGRAVWTEYKDHVDFYDLTVKDESPFYYKSGDVIETTDNSYLMSGFVTSSTKNVYIGITTLKSLEKITTVTVNNIYVEARGESGYLNGEDGYHEFVGRSGYTVTAWKVKDNAITIKIEKSSAWGNTNNNRPVVLYGKVKVTLT